MLVVTTAQSPGVSTLLQITGVLDAVGAAKLLSRLDRLIDQGHRHLVLDLAGVEFCNSSGVSALVRGRARASAAAGGLRIVAASPRVMRVLTLSGLARMFGLESAVDAVGSLDTVTS